MSAVFSRLGESELATVPTHYSQREFAIVYTMALVALQSQKGLVFSVWK